MTTITVNNIIIAIEVAIMIYLFLSKCVTITVIKEDSQEILIKESNEFLRKV
jgi:hypothetical protein